MQNSQIFWCGFVSEVMENLQFSTKGHKPIVTNSD